MSTVELERDDACVRGTLSAVAHAAVWLDPLGTVLYLNPAAEILLCRRLDEAFGLDLDGLFGRAPSAPAGECPVLSNIRRGTDYSSEGERVVTGDGRQLSISLSGRALLLRGTFRGALILMREAGRPRARMRFHPTAAP